MDKKNNKNNKRKERINREITSKKVRLVGKDVDSKVVSLYDAIKIAEDQELDLVEISVQDDISICKITDYQKFLYERKKKEKDQKKNATVIKVKEIRLTPTTGDHDFEFKLKHAKNFLQEKDKVKLTMLFNGREMDFKEIGQILMLKFVSELSEFGKPESMPQMEGRRMYVVVAPKNN